MIMSLSRFYIVYLCLALNFLSLQATASYGEQGMNLELIYPELDKALLSLWLHSGDGDSASCQADAKIISEEWTSVRKELLETKIEHLNIRDFVNSVESYLLSLDDCVQMKDYSCLRSISYHLLYEFRSLRQCFFVTEYPLDNLWEAMDRYLDIRKTINDRMFDLKEWFEFEDDINDFICKWEYYDLIHIKEIQMYYPGIDRMAHNTAKEEANSCIFTLLKSLESGFQSDFVLPCDALGEAFDKLLSMYAKSHSVLMM